jgi:hypothetical protein
MRTRKGYCRGWSARELLFDVVESATQFVVPEERVAGGC